MENRKVNLLKRYEAIQKERNKLTPAAKREVILVSVVVLIICIAAGVLFYRNFDLRHQIDANYAYLNDPVNVEHYNEVLAKDKEISILNSAINDIDNMQAMAETFPDFNSSFIDIIYGFDKAEVRSYSYDINTLIINASCNNMNEAPLYVDYLQDTGLFTYVSYNGYASTNSGYDYQVTCETLRGDK